MNIYSLLTYLIAVIILGVGCAANQPSPEEQYSDLVEENPPHRTPYVEKEITIDSVAFIRVNNEKTLLVKGTFPNPCTQILRVDERVLPEMLTLNIVGWQRYQQMCAQTITPFTYIHKGISSEQWEQKKLIVINEKEFELPLGSSSE
ncbi:hypothetical protein [Gracilimonas sp. BCB1]|uniref:hypothetical protein n=1 Tax=Gracilimonas sp. BCB1 TaxID=3152362 RepID=UPI0032D96CC2